MICYIHHVPGRLRIKVPTIKGNPFSARKLEEKLQGLAGTISARANTVTGSIVVHYDTAATDKGNILEFLGREEGFKFADDMGHEKYRVEKLSETGEKIGKAIFGMMIGKVLEGTPLSLLAAII